MLVPYLDPDAHLDGTVDWGVFTVDESPVDLGVAVRFFRFILSPAR